jgi:hypothetical protein
LYKYIQVQNFHINQATSTMLVLENHCVIIVSSVANKNDARVFANSLKEEKGHNKKEVEKVKHLLTVLLEVFSMAKSQIS